MRSGAFEERSAEVLRLAGSPDTFRQRAMAAVLDAGAGAVLSHESAAALWGLPGFERSALQVTRLRGGTRRPSGLAVVHEVRTLPRHHTVVLDGIRVTTGARLVADLAGSVHPLRLRRAYANARARRITTGPAVERVAAELCGKGWLGSTVLRELLAEEWPDDGRPETGLELRFVDLSDRAGLPRPSCQVRVGGDSLVGRVDFLYRPIKGVAEVNSDLFHRQVPDEEADEHRYAALRAAGFRVVESFDEHEIWHDGRTVIDRLRRMWATARRAG